MILHVYGPFVSCFVETWKFDSIRNVTKYTAISIRSKLIRLNRSLYLSEIINDKIRTFTVFYSCKFVNSRGRQISRISPVKISHYEMPSSMPFSFHSMYTMKRKLWSAVCASHLLFHVHRDFLSPNEIFSLWRSKIRDLLSERISEQLNFISNRTQRSVSIY